MQLQYVSSHTSHTVFDDSYHDSAERDREIPTVRIVDCCGFALYYHFTEYTVNLLTLINPT
jgi:hypothetical protein